MLSSRSQCGYAGHRDWRIPNVKELQTIVDYSNSDPAVARNFPGATEIGALNGYWTSTPFQPDETYAWYIDFGGGDVTPAFKTDLKAVRVVRGP